MTKTTLILLLAGLTAADAEMTARFRNGDSIHGELRDVRDDRIIWSSAAFFNEQPLILEELVDVLLPANAPPLLPDGDHIAIATLTNGDQVRGSLLKADEREIGLRTTFAGELVFRRDMVESLEIRDKPEILYAGPQSIEGWHQSDPEGWIFRDAALQSQIPSGIARDLGEHERFRLSFDLAWRGAARFKIFTCADSVDQREVENCFELVCQPAYAYLRKRVTRNGRTESITIGTTGGVREFQEQEKVRVELLQDKIEGRIRLILDGRMVADWREPAPGAGDFGGVIHFIADHKTPLTLSRIQLTSWDGQVEEEWQENDPFARQHDEQDDEPEEEVQPPTGIMLANGDHIDGEALGIEDGKVKLKTPLSTFTLPVSRMRSFSLRTPEEAVDPELTWKPRRYAGDIRASFPDGGHLTFELLGLGEDTIRGRSQTFGEAEFDLSAFSRLEFNLYRPSHPSR